MDNMPKPGQVDWQGLYNWSMEYQDGTRPSATNVQPMSKDEKNWLEGAMKEYTFNDSDRLKEVADELKKDADSDFKTLAEGENYGKAVDLMEELQELAEIHERNNLNLALCGGLQTVFFYIVSHPDPTVRRVACATFSGCVQNNMEVQNFARKFGALNLAHRFMEEKESKNKEAVLGALSSFLRAKNFEGKREFCGKMGGLHFLAAIILDQKQSLRLHKKALILLHDLVLNDESIVAESPTMVRRTVGEQMDILKRLVALLIASSLDLTSGQHWDVRETLLRILFRVFQICEDKHEEYKSIIVKHGVNLEAKLVSCEEAYKDLLTKEIELTSRVVDAPSHPIEKNFTKLDVKPEEKPMAVGM